MKTIDIHGRPIVNKHQALEILAKEEEAALRNDADDLNLMVGDDDDWDDFDYVDLDWLEPRPSPSGSR